MTITPTREELALLDTIASTEAPAYNVMYGHGWSGEDRTFSDYSRHPGRFFTITSGPNKGKKSSAAGRYQFLGSTWDRLASRYGLKDFSPRSQDLGAVALAREDYRRMTGRNLTADLASGDPAILAGVGKSLSRTWTSLPSGIEQGQGVDRFVSTFQKALGQPRDNASISARMTAAATDSGLSMASDLQDIRANLAAPDEPVGGGTYPDKLSEPDDPRLAPRPIQSTPFDAINLGPTLIQTRYT